MPPGPGPGEDDVDPDADSDATGTTGTGESGSPVGRVAGQDAGYAEETGAERRAAEGRDR